MSEVNGAHKGEDHLGVMVALVQKVVCSRKLSKRPATKSKHYSKKYNQLQNNIKEDSDPGKYYSSSNLWCKAENEGQDLRIVHSDDTPTSNLG